MFEFNINNTNYKVDSENIYKNESKLDKQSFIDFISSPFFRDERLDDFEANVRDIAVKRNKTVGWLINNVGFSIAEIEFLANVAQEKDMLQLTEITKNEAVKIILFNENIYIVDFNHNGENYGDFKIEDLLVAKYNDELFHQKINNSSEVKEIYPKTMLGKSREGFDTYVTGTSHSQMTYTTLESEHISHTMKYVDFLNLTDFLKEHLQKTFMEMARKAATK